MPITPINGRYIRAFEVAARCHQGQIYAPDEPYICHPVRVAHRLDTLLLQEVALLHDVLEDAPELADQLLPTLGLNHDQLDALEALNRAGSTYADYIALLVDYPIAALVKRADMEDNLSNLPRLAKVDPAGAARRYYRYKTHYQTIVDVTRELPRTAWWYNGDPLDLELIGAQIFEAERGGQL
jgi:(p)ppGpp synthase/HD superfamily hydrolase